MELATFSFSGGRWADNAFPAMDSERTLVLAFAASGFREDPGPLVELHRRYPRAQIMGCSTSGEIHGTKVLDDSIVVVVVRFAHTRVRCATASVAATSDSHAAGEMIARSLIEPGLSGVIVLSDGLMVNGSELVRGLNAVFPASVVVSGGLAGDGSLFRNTWVLKDGRPASHVVSAVALYGDRVNMRHGSKGGWDIFGPERVVTRSEGNVLYELDGKPALQLYKEYLGDRASGLPATALLFPLALRAAHSDDKQLVRTVLAVDDAAQSMTFAGDIPQGSLAQLMKANFDRLIQGASDAANLTGEQTGANGPTLAIAISCVGRRLVLGERTEEETEATLDVLPPGTEQVGFYSYGEISPYSSGGCDLHNQTMTLTAISEE
jgi:hypothetical protein